MRLAFTPYRLIFRFPAGTSRGVLHEKLTYFVKVWDELCPEKIGYGEAAVFEGLSRETAQDVERDLEACRSYDDWHLQDLSHLSSSAFFGIEQALRDLENGGNGIYWPSRFTEGKSEIIINGLVWMGDFDLMLKRLLKKIEQGFQCIKIKIGAVKWEEEMELIRQIRLRCGNSVTIRVDANGGLSYPDCMSKLNELASLDVHSIEQPIPAGNWDEMRRICLDSPVPVALDEELIGMRKEYREEMLSYIKPQFIILKPSLCFGFTGSSEWIQLADSHGIGWWITSALESTVGLSAIAQFTGNLNIQIPQGLGTGNLFENNFPSPLLLEGDKLAFTGDPKAFRPSLENLNWR